MPEKAGWPASTRRFIQARAIRTVSETSKTRPNVLKYGALSVLAGVLRVSWTLDETRLMLKWEESNVPIKRQPTRVGFGSQLLQRLLPHQLGAQVEMKFAPDGLKADISIQIA
jgi:two-component sensor histidine kinase